MHKYRVMLVAITVSTVCTIKDDIQKKTQQQSHGNLPEIALK